MPSGKRRRRRRKAQSESKMVDGMKGDTTTAEILRLERKTQTEREMDG